MINLGLSGVQRRALLAALVDVGTKIRVRVEIRNFANETLADVSDHVIDGQVDIDADSAIATRSLTVVLTDPNRALPFDTDNPVSTALFMDRMIRARYDVLVQGLGWVEIPVFTGPVTHLDRDGDQVTCEARGKEIFFRGAAWHPTTVRKHTKVTDAIRQLLTDGNPFYSETRLNIPDLAARLPHPISLARDAKIWDRVHRLGQGLDRQLFYDARGFARLRTHPDSVRFSFTGQGHVTSPIQIAYDENTVNAAIVRGADPKGPKRQIVKFALPRPSHPLSPERIGRAQLLNDAITDDPSLKTEAAAQARANRIVRDGLRQTAQVRFDSVPVPLLDPLDLCHVRTDDGSVEFRLHTAALPLVVGPPMPVGYLKRVSVLHARRHPKRPRRKQR